MGVSNEIVTTPVNPQEVYVLLGVGKYNGYYDIGYLCSNNHGKINKWSKNKPFRLNKIYEPSDSDKFFQNYGIDISSTLVYTYSDLISKALADSGWKYLPPRGNEYNEVYRLTDFVGYNHAAVSPITYYVPSSIPTTGVTLSYQMHFQINANAEIKITDFPEFSEGYGSAEYRYAIVYYKNESQIYLALGPKLTEIGSDGTDITVNFRSLGQWKCIFVVTSAESDSIDGFYTAYLPGGVFDINVYRVYVYADVTITNSSFNLWMDDSGIYGFYYPTISIVDTGTYFPQSTGLLTLKVYYYRGLNTPDGSFDVEDNTDNEFSFVGTGTKNTIIDFLTGEYISFAKYAPGVNFSSVTKVRIEASVKTLSGNGIFRMKGIYQWTISR